MNNEEILRTLKIPMIDDILSGIVESTTLKGLNLAREDERQKLAKEIFDEIEMIKAFEIKVDNGEIFSKNRTAFSFKKGVLKLKQKYLGVKEDVS